MMFGLPFVRVRHINDQRERIPNQISACDDRDEVDDVKTAKTDSRTKTYVEY